MNLMRWVSPRAIKESWDAPEDYPYAWNQPDAEGELSLDDIANAEPAEAGDGAVNA
jgi:hypothetical protein